MTVGSLRRLAVALLAAALGLSAEDAIGRPADDPLPDEAPIKIVVVEDDVGLQRLYLPIEVDGAKRYAIVDCGTARFWIASPQEEGKGEWIDNAWVATLGGRRLHVLGRRVPGFHEMIFGQRPIGAIGNDFLLAGTLVLDLAKGSLTRLPRGTVVPEAATWPSVPFTLLRGMILLDVTFDGQEAHVLLDTGAPKAVWIGQKGKKGDLLGETHDVHGEKLRYWLGAMSLGLGSETRRVKVQRMERFPHLEVTAEALGEEVDGLLGLSSLGRRRIVLDPEEGKMLLEPIDGGK